MITNEQKELIAIEVIRTLHSQFEKFPDDGAVNRNAPFHESFLQAFSEKFGERIKTISDFISLASWVHGLNTSLGQSFLEKTAHILCDGEKRSFTKEKKTNLRISSEQKKIVNQIITDLSNGNRNPNLSTEDSECILTGETQEIEATDFTVDVYFENQTHIICIELKTVRPNKGTFKSEKEKLLEAKLALKNKYPGKEVKYYLGFPFDPESKTNIGFDKELFMDYSVDFRKFFSKDEFLLSAELWDFLSETDQTMITILEIISTISTPKFEDIFIFLNNSENLKSRPEEYAKCSKDWYLYKSEFIAANFLKLPEKVTLQDRFQRKLNQPLFTSEINYRNSRIQFLLNTIEKNSRSV